MFSRHFTARINLYAVKLAATLMKQHLARAPSHEISHANRQSSNKVMKVERLLVTWQVDIFVRPKYKISIYLYSQRALKIPLTTSCRVFFSNFLF